LSNELLPTFGWPARPREHGGDAGGRANEPALGVGRDQEIDLLLGEVERRLDQQAQLDQDLGEGVDLAREGAVERARRRARRGFGAGVDQIGDGLGLGEVELVVEEGALGEFAGAGDAQVRQARLPGRRIELGRRFETAREKQLQHDRTAVRLQLEDVLAGVRVRCREEDRQALVDRGAVPVAKRQVGRLARRQRAAAERGDERPERGARDADDADRAAPARRRDGDDRVFVARQQHRIVRRRGECRRYLPSTPRRLLIRYCCAMERTLLVSQ
jgi:hypothetical protein